MKHIKTPNNAPARTSHQAHHSSFLPLKNPMGSLAKLTNPCGLRFRLGFVETGLLIGLSETRLRKPIGECRRQTPKTKPIKKPPMCEKLSRPGRRPRTKDITMSMMMKISSFHGEVLSCHLYSRSKRLMAMTPNSDPDAPMATIPLAAKFPPKTNPKIPLDKYTRRNRSEPIVFSISRPRVSCNSMLKPM